MYPDVRVYTRKMTMISKIYLFCALLVEVLLIYINVVTESQIAWSAITGLGFFYGYMLIRFAILGKTGYRAKITVLTLMAILIVIAIDFLIFTGIVTAQLFALIAFAFSLFLFLGTLIIGDRRARVELKRRFHVR